MKDLILGLQREAASGAVTDEEVQAAYLALIRRYPPDRDAKRFQQISHAREMLDTEKKRLSLELFNVTLPDRKDLAAVLLPDDGSLRRPSVQQVKKLLGKRL